MGRPGHVRISWLAGGREILVPELSLGEALDLMHYEVGVLKKLGMRDGLEKWETNRLETAADAEVVAETMFRRLQKADPALVRETMDAHLHGRVDLLALASIIARADAERFPDFRSGPQGKGANTPTVAAEHGEGKPTRWTRLKEWWRASPS